MQPVEWFLVLIPVALIACAFALLVNSYAMVKLLGVVMIRSGSDKA